MTNLELQSEPQLLTIDAAGNMHFPPRYEDVAIIDGENPISSDRAGALVHWLGIRLQGEYDKYDAAVASDAPTACREAEFAIVDLTDMGRSIIENTDCVVKPELRACFFPEESAA